MIRLILAVFSTLLPLSAYAQPDAGRPVILISIDGFRADYINRGVTPHLKQLANTGLSGKLKPSFPTKTFPNHYAMVTGKRPDHSGLVGNSMIDPRRPGVTFSLSDPKQAKDPFWWNEAEPIWVTAEKTGIRTATMFWPGSEVEIHGQRPTDWFPFSADISNEQRVRTAIDWLRRPDDKRPRFVTLYFDTVDTAGHWYGPDSPELNAAIAEVDQQIGVLVDSFAELEIDPVLIVVADHGMRAISADRIIQLTDLIDLPSIIPVVTGAYAAIEPAAGTDGRVPAALLGKHEHMECWSRQNIPERLQYGSNARVTEITCIPHPGWSILAGEPPYPVSGGTHGFDNQDEEMLAIFLARGLNGTGTVGTVDNIELYPLLASLLEIAPLPSDATGELLKYSAPSN